MIDHGRRGVSCACERDPTAHGSIRDAVRLAHCVREAPVIAARRARHLRSGRSIGSLGLVARTDRCASREDWGHPGRDRTRIARLSPHHGAHRPLKLDLLAHQSFCAPDVLGATGSLRPRPVSPVEHARVAVVLEVGCEGVGGLHRTRPRCHRGHCGDLLRVIASAEGDAVSRLQPGRQAGGRERGRSLAGGGQRGREEVGWAARRAVCRRRLVLGPARPVLVVCPRIPAWGRAGVQITVGVVRRA
jgi:hypothetical protein